MHRLTNQPSTHSFNRSTYTYWCTMSLFGTLARCCGHRDDSCLNVIFGTSPLCPRRNQSCVAFSGDTEQVYCPTFPLKVLLNFAHSKPQPSKIASKSSTIFSQELDAGSRAVLSKALTAPHCPLHLTDARPSLALAFTWWRKRPIY